MLAQYFPLITFVLVTMSTPGPNNISSAAMGVLHGYRKTLPYIAGEGLGFFFMIQVSAWISSALLSRFPAVEVGLHWAGALYILYLAYATFKASYGFESEEIKPLGFREGLFLQLLNPKLFVFGFTLFGTFLAPIAGQPGWLALAALVLASMAFCIISIWALFGAAIKNYLKDARIRVAVNAILSLLLVYTALTLVDIL
jgi:cysteine/O-acetylserine efflux protein